jgi:class 3 adenylate cyclase
LAPQGRAAERLQRLVPKECTERLLATRGQVSKERRTVTMLFSDVKGSTAMAESLEPEEWTEVMDGAFDVLIESVYRYEGTLARLMGDAVLAFVRALIAHEDDPERACREVLEIVPGAKEYAAIERVTVRCQEWKTPPGTAGAETRRGQGAHTTNRNWTGVADACERSAVHWNGR